MVCESRESVSSLDNDYRPYEYFEPALTLVDYAEVVRPQISPVKLARIKANKRRMQRIENAVVTVTAAIGIGASLFGAAHYFVSPQTNQSRMALVTVAPGDTLWTVAQQATTSNSSTANTLECIRAINPSLAQGQPLKVGEKILVPISGNAGDSSAEMASVPKIDR